MMAARRTRSATGAATGTRILPAACLAAALLAAPAGGADDDGDRLGVLFRHIQELQDEVRRLQGAVEEQNYRIERLVREQRERYIELDRRLLGAGAGAAEALPGDDAAPSGGAPTPGATAAAPGGAAASGSPAVRQAADMEREAYNDAFSIMRTARGRPTDERMSLYQAALDKFSALIKAHPNGEFTPNAFYWTGELHSALGSDELARQAFVQVVNLYRDHPKAPDALHKLGLVYERLGDRDRAVEYFDRVIRDYPQSSAAELAERVKAEFR